MLFHFLEHDGDELHLFVRDKWFLIVPRLNDIFFFALLFLFHFTNAVLYVIQLAVFYSVHVFSWSSPLFREAVYQKQLIIELAELY